MAASRTPRPPPIPPRHTEKKIMNARFQRISPFLWFDDQAEQAATLYTP